MPGSATKSRSRSSSRGRSATRKSVVGVQKSVAPSPKQQSNKAPPRASGVASKKPPPTARAPLLFPFLEFVPEPLRFAGVGTLTNGVNVVLQRLLAAYGPSLVGRPITMSECFFTVVLCNMPNVHFVEMSCVYGLRKGELWPSFFTVAPLRLFMVFFGTMVTKMLEMSPVSTFSSPFEVLGLGNVQWMTLIIVGCVNSVLTKTLLAWSSKKSK
jgi:hypothetical protein